MGLIHFIIAIILKSILFLPMYIINGSTALLKRSFFKYNHNLALMLDIYGSHLCKHVFNAILLQKYNVQKYGEGMKTISHVTAMNYRSGDLKPLGKLLAKVLILFKDKAF